jgi:hypothetical protein
MLKILLKSLRTLGKIITDINIKREVIVAVEMYSPIAELPERAFCKLIAQESTVQRIKS